MSSPLDWTSEAIRGTSWLVPSDVTASYGRIVAPIEPAWHEVHTAPAMLSGFVQLVEASDEAIAEYGKTWGQLHVCDEHMLPVTHVRFSIAAASYPPCRIAAIGAPSSRTPILVWRYWSRAAQALLRIANALREGNSGQPGDWHAISQSELDIWRREMVLFARYQPPNEPRTNDVHGQALAFLPRGWFDDDGQVAASIDAQRTMVASALNEWLLLGDVNLALDWTASEPSIHLGSPSLFSALGIELMLAVSRSDQLEVCTSCGNPFPAQRRPRPGQRRYCPACGRDAAVRDAARAYRARKADEAKKGGRGGKTR